MSEVINPVKKCNSCDKKQGELLRCAKCKQVYYCGQDCQKKNWPDHKKICKQLSTNVADSTNTQGTNTKKNKNEEGLDAFGKLKHIGSGNFSQIFQTVSKKDGKVYAIKQVEKAKVQRMRKQADVFMEKHCLMKLKDCEHVVQLYGTFQDELSLFFQMQFPSGGELWERSKTFGVIAESMYRYYVYHVIKAVSVLHNKYQIVHRDLKPENILLDENNKIKLIDFGTAKDLDRPDIKGAGNGLKGKKQFQHYVGTAHYMAPQCIHNKASQKKSDIYSLSGVLYFLKVGSPPFQGGSQYLTFTKSLQKQLLTCPQLFDPILQDLVHKMNQKQMNCRPDINQVMEHQYFKDVDFDNLPTFEQMQQKISPQQKYLCQLANRLIEIMEKQKNPKVQKRRQIYEKQVKPIFQEQYAKKCELLAQNTTLLRRLQVMQMQCECFLNIRDNSDISFTQIYEESLKKRSTTMGVERKDEEEKEQNE